MSTATPTVAFESSEVTLHHGDCLDVLASLPDASVDSVVTDPPYGLEFMGRDWDAPWRESDVNADAGMSDTGYSDGGNRLPRPSFTGSTNPKCLVCKGTRRGRRDGTAKVAVCMCEDGGRFPNVRAVEMRAFGEWCESWAVEALRVLKPGGYMLAFGGTRTWHRLAVAVEDAGFEIRDSIAWMYGSGFPKSMNVATAVEQHRAAKPVQHLTDLLPDEEAFCRWMRDHSGLTASDARRLFGSDRFITGEVQIVNTATADNPRMGRRAMVPTYAAWQKARTSLATEPPDWVESLVKSPPQPTAGTPGEVWTPGKGRGTIGDNEWAGWGTALKPAFEPVVVARKPLAGTVAANVLKHGTGALNIDASRIAGTVEGPGSTPRSSVDGRRGSMAGAMDRVDYDGTKGRFPANVILDESQAAELDKQSGIQRDGVAVNRNRDPEDVKHASVYGMYRNGERPDIGYGGVGGASRFFYTAKADSAERPKVNGIAHPTVKPLDLMRYLVRLVTPKGGVVLEPFAGSGTTLEAAVLEGFRAIGIEREADYLPLILKRLEKPHAVGLDLFGDVA